MILRGEYKLKEAGIGLFKTFLSKLYIGTYFGSIYIDDGSIRWLLFNIS